MSSNGVYNHRSLQPPTRQIQGPGQPGGSGSRLTDAFEIIKQEFELITSDRDLIRTQRDEFEAAVNAQVSEVNIIRRSLYDLEAQQGKVRQHYEDEINRLRAEISTLRQGGSGMGESSSQGFTGIPGLAKLSTPRLSSASATNSFLRDRDREQAKERCVVLTPPSSERDREPRDKVREAREVDRVIDQRDAKRLKAERPLSAQILDSPSPNNNSATLPPAHTLYSSTNSSLSTLPSRESYQVTLPPLNVVPGNSIPEELSLQNVTPEFKKEGTDWFAVFNPKIHRTLDINLTHNLVHASVVCCVQFSADGKYVATGCNRTAQIYDVKTGVKVCVLADETAGKTGDLYIRSVRFSPDGKLLATGAEDRKIRIWDIAKKRVRHVFDGHQQEIYSLDFSKDGRLIVSGSGDKTTRIWDMTDCSSRVFTINDSDALGTDAGVTSVAISPNGRLVAAGSLDTLVRIWDVSTGVLLERLRGHRDSVYSVAFTPDGRGLVSGSLDKTLKYWDLKGLVNSLANLGKNEASADPGISPKKPGEKSSPCTMDFVGHKDYVLSVAVSHDARWVVSGSKDRCVQFWDSRTATLQFMLQGHKNSVISLDVNPAGGLLATGSGDSMARIWSYTNI
ncbi:WD40-repeat-containing domain protein [Collybia nuda]|uniref:WD40-repeat-containing domain protein n=1 Tax=Collybia nuda TaxID=64659 RepID=A0A9P6CEN9_9AGAR|nr:WD40-repeat-containing domain protein [Collybia nuda]